MAGKVFMEEKRLQERTDALWTMLHEAQFELREMSRETERLRIMKDEAKAEVMSKHPNLFDPKWKVFSDDETSDEDEQDTEAGLPEHYRELNRLLNPKPDKTKKRAPDVNRIHELDQDYDNLRREVREKKKKAGLEEEFEEPLVSRGHFGALGVGASPGVIPVPVETLRRLIADSNRYHQASPDLPLLQDGQTKKQKAIAAMKSKGHGKNFPFMQYYRKTNNAADDTSNDAADLTNQEFTEESEEERIQIKRKTLPPSHIRRPKPLKQRSIGQRRVAYPQDDVRDSPGELGHPDIYSDSRVEEENYQYAVKHQPVIGHPDGRHHAWTPEQQQYQQPQHQSPQAPQIRRREQAQVHAQSSPPVQQHQQSPPAPAPQPVPRQSTTAPPARVSPPASVPPPSAAPLERRDPSPSPPTVHNAPPPTSTTSPPTVPSPESNTDANYAIDSANVDEKLYSAASSTSNESSKVREESKAKEQAEEKSKAFLSELAKQRTNGNGNGAAKASSSISVTTTDNESEPVKSASPPPKPKNPLEEYAKKQFTIRMQSDSDSPANKIQEDEALSGPEAEESDEDFWN